MKQCNLIYHIMVDRFYPSPSVYRERCFNGGNLRGVISQLDYIQKLGMTGIMLSPFCCTAAYHGYHITDYEKVDPHFGCWEDVKDLVQEVHRRGMTIIADFVPNHCHETNALYSSGTRKSWFQYDKNGKVKGYAGLGNLPQFDTENKEVQQYFIHRAMDLCRIGFDALRIDHAAGPSYRFLKKLRKCVKKYYPNVQLFGEVWGDLDFKPRNRLRFFFNRWRYKDDQEARQLEYVGVLDGVLDFRYHGLICDAINESRALAENEDLRKSVQKHFSRYPSNFGLWLFLDNHDLNRFLYVCKGNRKLLEDAVAFTRQWQQPFLIYYGTEQGMMNKEDVFCGKPYADEQVRECMVWNP